MRRAQIEVVLFDFDGTLTQPGVLDFARIREEMGCPPETGILRFIESRKTDAERAAAEEILLNHERRAAAESKPNEAAEETVKRLHESGLRIGILTRNTRASVERAFENFEHLGFDWFELVITRDEGEPLKPDPGSVLEAARRFGVGPEALLMVGDFRHDIDAGREAGSWTTLIRGEEEPEWQEEVRADYVIRSLEELPGILRWHRPLNKGKLPNDMLEELLSDASPGTEETAAGGEAEAAESPRGAPARETQPAGELLISPGVGEDVAAISAEGFEVLIAKSDPITFPTAHIGSHTITINTNDVLCSGGVPRWFLATAIFPPGTTGYEIREVYRDMLEAASRIGVTVVGGHTEISDAVVRPVVSGSLLGTAAADGILTKSDVRPGDRIIMTKRPGLEGTAIIADDLADALRAKAVSPTVIEAASGFADRLSIFEEARVAAESGRAVALHDVTEGGVATALEELARAAGLSIRVDMDALDPYPETRTLCEALRVDPLGLIGSGSLLIAVRPADEAVMLELLAEAGTEARSVGEAAKPAQTGAGRGGSTPRTTAGDADAAAGSRPASPYLTGVRGGEEAPFPRFEVDELARLYSRLGTED